MPRVDPNAIVTEKAIPFQWLGIEFSTRNGVNVTAETCPFCGSDDGKFSVNVKTSQYQCFQCQAKGNICTFLKHVHKTCLDQTTSDHYLALKERRGIASQTFKRHELAWDSLRNRWLIPFKNAKGNIVNFQVYCPYKPDKPDKFNVGGLPLALYGLDHLKDQDKLVLLCEGPFDAMAVDWNIGGNNRQKYQIMAIPGTFKDEWAELFQGFKVRCLFDNDPAGEKHASKVYKLLGGVATELEFLKWPADCFNPTYVKDINDLLKERPDIKIVGWSKEHSYKHTPLKRLKIGHGFLPPSEQKPTDWVWPDHMPCGSYVSFSGEKGTFKSTIAAWIAARYSKGERMPECDKDGLPAGHVLYVFAEDDRETVEERYRLAEGDADKWHPLGATVGEGEQLNILDHLPEIREEVRKFGIRLVILDGQNSLVGAEHPDGHARTDQRDQPPPSVRPAGEHLSGWHPQRRPDGPGDGTAEHGRCRQMRHAGGRARQGR